MSLPLLIFSIFLWDKAPVFAEPKNVLSNDPAFVADLTATERFEQLIESSPWRSRWVALLLGALLAGLDYLSGPEIIIPIYFIAPVMLLAWNWGARSAVGLAIVLSVAHVSFMTQWGLPPSESIAVINACLRASVLIFLALMTARLGAQTRAIRARVQLLEGVLPTCSFCKDIRNPDGEWERIESYVSRHSDAEFSHGICPPCAQKHYGMKLENAVDR